MATQTEHTIHLQHDGKLTVAVGKSRKATLWENKQVKWSVLVGRVTHTKRTAETYKAYMAMPKDKQDHIKDVGGFVGGTVQNGRRGKQDILNRTFIALDVDHGTNIQEVLDSLEMIFGCAFVWYTTHKHHPTAPRFRILIPMTRAVTPDEYEAISRKIASIINIEEIKEHGLSVHFDQANDITLVNNKVAEALSSVNYRGFDGKNKRLFFAFDLLVRKKIDPETSQVITYDMSKEVREKVKLLNGYGIPPKHLTFYMLIGYNTTEEEDLFRVDLLKSLGCEIYPMLYRDLNGRVGIDGKGNQQSFHCRALRDWIISGLYRKTPLHEFDRYQKYKNQTGQLTLF